MLFSRTVATAGSATIRARALPVTSKFAATTLQRSGICHASAVHTMGQVSPDLAQAYNTVAAKLKELDSLNGISGLMQWDEMVMMPEGAATARGAQKSALTGVLHDKSTDAELGQLLNQLKSATPGALGAVEAAVVRDAHKSYVKATALPKELVQRISVLETDAYAAWVKARKDNDYASFAPFLQQWVDISREKTKLIDPTKPVYDVLLDDFEKGMTTARLDEVFAQVREGLIPLIADIKAKGCKLDASWMNGNFDVDVQAKLCRQIALDLGFDLEKGRLDVSVHPFTGGSGPTDVRMTTRFKKETLVESLTGAIHETGHALYEQGRNPDWAGLPVSAALSMGVHESQSLLWERMVALSEPFQSYLLPLLQKDFPETFGSATARKLYEGQNVITEPSLIRVEADEVTYPMHVILRYELERGLLDGTVKVDDLPKVWNEKMQAYLGATPPTDTQGVLQDIHWSSGAFGYFPTYTLGAMFATQVFQAAQKAIPELEAQIVKGDFAPLKAWLNEKVHRLGSLPPTGDDLMIAVTGSPLDPAIFLAYLRKKYTELYKL